MKISLKFLLIPLFAFIVFCGLFDNRKTGGTHLPRWLDVKLNFDRLPNPQNTTQIIFDIKVIGDDYQFTVNKKTGDTLNYLCMKFKPDNWVVPVNEDAKIRWQGKVNIGQKIKLKPEFTIDLTKRRGIPDSLNVIYNAYPQSFSYYELNNSIRLEWRFIENEKNEQVNVDTLIEYGPGTGSVYTLYFDYRTGLYSWEDDIIF